MSSERRREGNVPPPPSRRVLDAAARRLEPWVWLTAPKLFGMERVPERGPLLFVGNHTVMGVFDGPVMFYELYKRKGLYPRALGDHVHFRVPLWGDMLQRMGVVDGTPENCAALFRAGESVLVYPGGGREVAKRRGEAYKLIWKQRTGFARLALEHRVPIVPFAAVGAEEAWDIVLDGNDVLGSRIGPLFKRLGLREDVLVPLVRGVGPTPFPRLERLYFWFGAPVDPRPFIRPDDPQASAFALREATRGMVEEGIALLQRARENDENRGLVKRLAERLQEAAGRVGNIARRSRSRPRR